MNTLLDEQILRDLQELSPDNPLEFLGELFQSYEKQAQVDLLEIQKHSADSNWDSVGKAAHRLKSASSQLGVTEVGNLANQIESLLRQGPGNAHILSLVKEIQSTYAASHKQIQLYKKKS